VIETAATAHFTTGVEDGDHLVFRSDRRADAIVLDALIDDQPESALIPKLVRGLLEGRRRGRWSSTQENAFVLLALDHYFGIYEKAAPDFVARAWLGDRYAGAQAFRGRTTDRQRLTLPMGELMRGGGAQDLLLEKEGPGRLYYRIGLSYAPLVPDTKALDRGFAVERGYEAVDDAGDVRRDAEGVWHVRAGARVRVWLRLSSASRRYHVALVDPLPAGLEPLNSRLATTETVPGGSGTLMRAIAAPGLGGPGRPGHWREWLRGWYEHQNLRDDRAEVFTSELWGGIVSYSYVARATTPGTFTVPPPKAEEMYHPETFGRGVTDKVIVEAP
jgi:uncharacterized protein YfaS (alpha-2-macroglobulin family)